jgi:hypothetical protein
MKYGHSRRIGSQTAICARLNASSVPEAALGSQMQLAENFTANARVNE